MKGKISFQCLEGAYVCQILPKEKELIDALAGQGFKLHKSPTSDNYFFGLQSGEFSPLRALGGESGEITFSPIDKTSGGAFRMVEQTLFSCLKKIYSDRGRAAQEERSRAALAAAEKAFEALPVEDRARLEFENSAELKSEFPSLEVYVAYRKADEAGKVRIFRKGGGL